jgi:hypothetical protein
LIVKRPWGLGTRAPTTAPQVLNDRCSLDFVADQFTDGRRMRILVDHRIGRAVYPIAFCVEAPVAIGTAILLSHTSVSVRL